MVGVPCLGPRRVARSATRAVKLSRSPSLQTWFAPSMRHVSPAAPVFNSLASTRCRRFRFTSSPGNRVHREHAASKSNTPVLGRGTPPSLYPQYDTSRTQKRLPPRPLRAVPAGPSFMRRDNESMKTRHETPTKPRCGAQFTQLPFRVRRISYSSSSPSSSSSAGKWEGWRLAVRAKVGYGLCVR